MFHQLQAVIRPPLSLARSLRDWPAIAAALSDAPRQRRPQPVHLRAILTKNNC
jgi:hypothetical protein